MVFVLFTIFSWETLKYFSGPDFDYQPPPEPLPRFDPTATPQAMTESCRREGKQLAAQRSAGEWIYDCVDADLRKR